MIEIAIDNILISDASQDTIDDLKLGAFISNKCKLFDFGSKQFKKIAVNFSIQTLHKTIFIGFVDFIRFKCRFNFYGMK